MRVQTFAEQMVFATLRIQTNVGVGTGFVVSHDLEAGKAVFLVTNKHVVEGAAAGSLFFTATSTPPPRVDEPAIGDRIDVRIENFDTWWTGHPDKDVDVTVAPIAGLLANLASQKRRPFFRAITTTQFATEADLDELDVVEEVTIVGYPNGIYDELNLVPVFRRGTTASPPNLDYEGRPVFLVDASIFPGSSGSPVVLLNQGVYMPRRGPLTVGSRFKLLGLVASVFFRQATGEIQLEEIPTGLSVRTSQQEMLDLGIVFKARTVLETIEEVLRHHRS